jgi:SAM-dependent methyltransferase
MPRATPPIPADRALVRVDHPGEHAFNALAHRQVHNALAIAAEAHAHGRLVDIGCGLKPYAGLFAPYVSEHIGVDHPESPHALTSVDVLATAYEIPLEDGTFNTALMSEVLEHLEEPREALAEAHRLLRSDGKMILTTPFMWPLHEEPRDFFRYTPHGLRYLFESAGFKDVQIQPMAGQWSTLALLHGYALRGSPLRRLGGLLAAYVRVAHWSAVKLDRWRYQPWMSWNHLVVARKP